MVDGAPVVSTGLRVTGVTTSTNVSVAQSVTATNFYGDGSFLQPHIERHAAEAEEDGTSGAVGFEEEVFLV